MTEKDMSPYDSNTPKQKVWTLAQRTSAVFMILAGYIGATVFIHSDGLFVTFMTGNAEKNMVGIFQGRPTVTEQSLILSIAFFIGVFMSALCRRRIWKDRPCCVIIITTISLMLASLCAILAEPTLSREGDVFYWFWALPFIALGTGALNGAFTSNGETKTPVTYHTGSLVKFAQAMEKHLASAGTYHDWVPYAISYGAFSAGAGIGGITSIFIDGAQMLIAGTAFSFIIFLCVHKIREADL